MLRIGAIVAQTKENYLKIMACNYCGYVVFERVPVLLVGGGDNKP